MKFRKRPVVIEAIRFMGPFSIDEMHEAWGESFAKYFPSKKMAEAMAIQTLEGVMQACIGDWIIRGIKGEFYPCKADIFDASYETAEVE